MEKYRLAINPEYGFLICRTHGTVIENFKNHYHSCHKCLNQRVPFDLVQQEIDQAKAQVVGPGLPNDWYDRQMRPEVQGLPIKNGLCCSLCIASRYYSKNANEMRMHFAKHHPDNIQEFRQFSDTAIVQTLRKNPKNT